MCLSPIQLNTRDFDRKLFPFEFSSIYVPCGKCVECLKDRQNSWKLRLVHEASCWSHMYFFTLTYSEQSVPRNDLGNSTASVRDLQNWLKRFRINHKRKYDYDILFKYFICAEYAPAGDYISRKGVLCQSTCRPHYHGIIFSNEPFEKFSPLFSEWTSLYGFVDKHEVAISTSDTRGERSSVANYVSKYCCKGEFASRRDEIERGEIERAFTICSKGIGASYVDRYRSHHLAGFKNTPLNIPTDEQFNKIISRRFVLDGQFRYKMPRYYIDRIYRQKVTKYVRVCDLETLQIKLRPTIRYCSESFLCDKISRYFTSILLERDEACYYDEQERNAHAMGFVSCEHYDISSKKARLSSKLRKFYQNNACKNSTLCVD